MRGRNTNAGISLEREKGGQEREIIHKGNGQRGKLPIFPAYVH